MIVTRILFPAEKAPSPLKTSPLSFLMRNALNSGDASRKGCLRFLSNIQINMKVIAI